MHDETKAVHHGRNPFRHYGMVNPPIYQTSTILFPTIEAYEKAEYGQSYYYEDQMAPAADLSYGIGGTPTTFALGEALASLEGADHCLLFPSGLSAIAIALMAFVNAGDHVLVADSVYGPTRRFCDKELKRFGIETTYYDPVIGENIASMMRPNTKVVFVESPGSLTFEVQDIPAISKVAKAHGAVVMMDNSWATPLYFKPFTHGVDLSIHAISKYIGGHSDIVMGAITTNKEHYTTLYRAFRDHGVAIAPHDCYLAQRGLRSLAVRLAAHDKNAREVAAWLAKRPEVLEVLHPALPGAPGHDLWKRDFTGACGLFSFILKPYAPEKVASMLNTLKLFGKGCSWGGYESLILRFDPSHIRTATSWNVAGPAIRIHIGLEHPEDLMEDLEHGFRALL